jgi:hypothetical protein
VGDSASAYGGVESTGGGDAGSEAGSYGYELVLGEVQQPPPATSRAARFRLRQLQADMQVYADQAQHGMRAVQAAGAGAHATLSHARSLAAIARMRVLAPGAFAALAVGYSAAVAGSVPTPLTLALRPRQQREAFPPLSGSAAVLFREVPALRGVSGKARYACILLTLPADIFQAEAAQQLEAAALFAGASGGGSAAAASSDGLSDQSPDRSESGGTAGTSEGIGDAESELPPRARALLERMLVAAAVGGRRYAAALYAESTRDVPVAAFTVESWARVVAWAARVHGLRARAAAAATGGGGAVIAGSAAPQGALPSAAALARTGALPAPFHFSAARPFGSAGDGLADTVVTDVDEEAATRPADPPVGSSIGQWVSHRLDASSEAAAGSTTATVQRSVAWNTAEDIVPDQQSEGGGEMRAAARPHPWQPPQPDAAAGPNSSTGGALEAEDAPAANHRRRAQPQPRPASPSTATPHASSRLLPDLTATGPVVLLQAPVRLTSGERASLSVSRSLSLRLDSELFAGCCLLGLGFT